MRTSTPRTPASLGAVHVRLDVVADHHRAVRFDSELGQRRRVELGRGLAHDRGRHAGGRLDAEDEGAAVEGEAVAHLPCQVAVHHHEGRARRDLAKGAVEQLVAEHRAGTAEHDHIGLLGLGHQPDPVEISRDIAARQDPAPGRGMVLPEMGAGGDRCRHDLLDLTPDTGTGQGPRHRDPGPRRRVGEEAERQPGIAKGGDCVGRSGERLPVDGEHAVDVEQHPVDRLRARAHGPTVAFRPGGPAGAPWHTFGRTRRSGGVMDDDGAAERAAGPRWADEIERAVLSETAEGRAIAAAFVTSFGAFVSDTVRPILREVADSGGEPQLLVNGLAQTAAQRRRLGGVTSRVP